MAGKLVENNLNGLSGALFCTGLMAFFKISTALLQVAEWARALNESS